MKGISPSRTNISSDKTLKSLLPQGQEPLLGELYTVSAYIFSVKLA